MANTDSLESEIGTWYGETRMERLDRCRKFLFGQQIVTETVNDAIRKALEEARDREHHAEQDDMAESIYKVKEEPDEAP
jgi:hypothetical protein